MTSVPSSPAPGAGFTVVSVLFGGLLIALGVAALGAPIVTTLATTLTLGVLLALAGAAGVFAALGGRGQPGRLWAVLWALAILALGLMMIFSPASAAATITLFAAFAFLIRGFFAVLLAFASRRILRGWWWVALGGAVTFALGGMLLSNWPLSAAVMLGTLVAIDLIVYGVSVVLGALGARRA